MFSISNISVDLVVIKLKTQSVKKCYTYRLLFILFTFTAACNANSQKVITIKGNIANLPDGKLFLVKTNGEKIDSVETQNGKFKLNINLPEHFEPFLVSVEHIDKDNRKRQFSFPSDKKMHGGGLSLSALYLGEDTEIKGSLIDFHPKYLKLPDNVLLVDLDRKVEWNKQTKVMYAVDFQIPEIITNSFFETIKKTIRKYPYSYYLLDGITNNISKFSNEQLKQLLQIFDIDLRCNSHYLI